MTTFCTLFDHNYLDKGLAMYESLEKVCDEFELYVLCMSDRCYEILSDLNYSKIKLISLKDFEDPELLRVKPTRGVGEYCWTCSSSLVIYILQNFHPDYCAYIDSDLYFFSDPKVVIEEMKRKGASVQITGHRFNDEQKNDEHIVGKYCVEYNTFRNDSNSLRLLKIWRAQCLECCSTLNDGIHWGDQKYMDNWCDDYDFVIETENLGMGVAPWNLAQYELESIADNQIVLKCKGKSYPIVFFHYQCIQYMDKSHVKMNVRKYNKPSLKLTSLLYNVYLLNLRDKKEILKTKYGIDVLIKAHPGYHKEVDFITRLCNVMKHPKTLLNKLGLNSLLMLCDKDIIKI